MLVQMVQFASYLRRVLCKTRLIFPRINGPNMSNKARHGLQNRRRSSALNKSRNDLMILSSVVKTPCRKEIFLEVNNEWPNEKWNFPDGNLCSVNQSSRLS